MRVVSTLIGNEELKFHYYDDITGYFMCGLKLISYIVFVQGIWATYLISRNNVKKFVLVMFLAGSLYLLAFPIFYALCKAVKLYYRFKIMMFGILFVPIIVVMIISQLISIKDGTY